jgi:hypothetical protein
LLFDLHLFVAHLCSPGFFDFLKPHQAKAGSSSSNTIGHALFAFRQFAVIQPCSTAQLFAATWELHFEDMNSEHFHYFKE